MNFPILIIGTAGLAHTALEIFEANEILVYGFITDTPQDSQKEIHGIPVIGNLETWDTLKISREKTNFFVSHDSNKVRKKITQLLTEWYKVVPVNAISRTSYISKFASIGHGNLIAPSVYIGTGVRLGSHCQLLANTTLEPDAVIEDFVHIGPGCVIGSEVHIEEEVFIGSGSVIISGVKIGKGARIGAGSVVMQSVGSGQTMFGVPAVQVKK